MNTRGLQAWALVIAGLVGLLGLVPSISLPLRIALLVGTLLLILGVPAILEAEPGGSAGLIGLILLEVGAVVALVFTILSLVSGPDLGGTIAFIGALAAAAGRLIVGWITSRGKVFSPWTGWAFVVSGLANLAGGLVGPGSGAALGILAAIAEAAALIGYGLTLRRAAG